MIATAGRADKRHWLRRIGFKTVLDHRAAAFPEHLARAAGSGLTLNYENVGGTVLAAANGCMRRDGRIVLCGLVSQYEQAAARAAPANMGHLQRLGVRILPFIASDHLADWTHFQQSMGRVLGSLSWRLDVRRGGLEAVPDALVGVLRGDNLGKRVVYFG